MCVCVCVFVHARACVCVCTIGNKREGEVGVYTDYDLTELRTHFLKSLAQTCRLGRVCLHPIVKTTKRFPVTRELHLVGADRHSRCCCRLFLQFYLIKAKIFQFKERGEAFFLFYFIFLLHIPIIWNTLSCNAVHRESLACITTVKT